MEWQNGFKRRDVLFEKLAYSLDVVGDIYSFHEILDLDKQIQQFVLLSSTQHRRCEPSLFSFDKKVVIRFVISYFEIKRSTPSSNSFWWYWLFSVFLLFSLTISYTGYKLILSSAAVSRLWCYLSSFGRSAISRSFSAAYFPPQQSSCFNRWRLLLILLIQLGMQNYFALKHTITAFVSRLITLCNNNTMPIVAEA